jgi:uncharacterized protein YpuA (DUF1002 family)
MAKHEKKVRSRTAAWLIVVAMMVLAGVSVGQLASATTSGGTTTTTTGATTTTVKPTTTTGATTTTVKPTTTTSEVTTTTRETTSSSVGGTVSSAPTTSIGGVSSTRAGGPLPFTGGASLPMLLAALALLGLGAASLFAGTRRRRRAA